MPPNELGMAMADEFTISSDDFMIVLDECDRAISTDLAALLSCLVANLPPLAHLALVGRTDRSLPLARLRAQAK